MTSVYATTLATLRNEFERYRSSARSPHSGVMGRAWYVNAMGEIRRSIASLKRGVYGVDAECCQDCLLLFANGDVSGWSGTDQELALWQDAIDERTDGYHVAIGGSHDEGCPNHDVYVAECDCDNKGFCQTSCDTCGRSEHGDRYAVTLFVNPERN